MPATGCPNIFSATPALGLVFSQQEYSSAWQARQAPQAIGKGTTTRSPTRSLDPSTPGPTSTTSPMNSWPRTSPFSIVGTKPSSRCRSDPQIAVDVIFTTASRLLSIFGSGTSCTSTLFGPVQQLAFTPRPPCGPGAPAAPRRSAAGPGAAGTPCGPAAPRRALGAHDL